jgi:hypothetical protein
VRPRQVRETDDLVDDRPEQDHGRCRRRERYDSKRAVTDAIAEPTTRGA